MSHFTRRISEYKITMAILIYTRWNLSFIILWVSCGKKLGKKSDCNSSWDILFHFTSFYKYQLCKKHKNILFSINVQLCKNAANVLSSFFIERDNVIETICSSCFFCFCACFIPLILRIFCDKDEWFVAGQTYAPNVDNRKTKYYALLEAKTLVCYTLSVVVSNTFV